MNGGRGEGRKKGNTRIADYNYEAFEYYFRPREGRKLSSLFHTRKKLA